MAKIEKEVPAVPVDKIARGLSVRTFEGTITDPQKKGLDGKNEVIARFNYDRIVFPWSRTGKDVDNKDVTGSVPTLAEVLSYCQKLNFKTEVVLKDGEPEGPSVVTFLVDGLNSHFNQTARAASLNTPESAIVKAIATFAKMTGKSFAEAEKTMFPSGRPDLVKA